MSNKNETPVVKAKFSIVRRIVAFLELGENGKLDSFFLRVEKTLNREIEAYKKNIDIIKFEAKQKADEYDDKIEDAEKAVEEAFMNVTPEQVDSNQKQVDFLDSYLSNLKRAKSAVTSLKDAKADAAKASKGEVDNLNDKINELKETIASVIED